jgi:hypothetical protein
MARISTTHLKFTYGPEGLPIAATETVHFTRTDMPQVYADGVKESLYCTAAYVSDHTVIVEYAYND